jgi:hypothetical protein
LKPTAYLYVDCNGAESRCEPRGIPDVAAGQWVERSERIDLSQLFDRMSAAELEEYAKDGKLPDWFTGAVEGATTNVGREETERG